MKPISHADLEAMLSQSPFQSFLGLSISKMGELDEDIGLTMSLNPNVERFAGSNQYHGGAIASFIDVAGDFALIHRLGYPVPTINLRVDYLRPAVDSQLHARPRVRQAGRSIGVVDIEVIDDKNRLIAVGRGTYSTKRS